MQTRLTRRTLVGGSLIAPLVQHTQSPSPVPAAVAVPTYRGNPERTGENPGPAPTGEPVALWQARLGTVISGSPSVVGGVVYIGSLGPGTIEGGFLHAVEAATGIEMWRLGTAPGDGIFTTPTVSDRVAIAGSYDGIVIAADPVTGSERWRFQAEAPFYASPALVDGVAWLADTGGHLYALDAETGAERWRVVVGSGSDHAFGTPAVAAGVVYAVVGSYWANEGTCLYAWDAGSGAERWCFAPEQGTLLRGTPVVAGGRLYVLTRGEAVLVLDLVSGEEVGHHALASTTRAELAVVDGILYAATDDGQLHAAAAETGASLWSIDLDTAGGLTTGPCVADGTIYVGGRDGTIYATDAESGGVRWARDVARLWGLNAGNLRSSPAIVNGVIYVGGDDGALRAVGGAST